MHVRRSIRILFLYLIITPTPNLLAETCELLVTQGRVQLHETDKEDEALSLDLYSLFEKMKRGDERSGDEFNKLFYGRFYDIAAALVKDKEARMDVMQNALISLLSYDQKIDPPRFLYLCITFVERRAVDIVRRQSAKKEKVLITNYGESSNRNRSENFFSQSAQTRYPEPSADVLEKELRYLRREFIDELLRSKLLSEEDQVLVRMFYLESRSTTDILKALNLKKTTDYINMRLFKVRKKLLEQFKLRWEHLFDPFPLEADR